jgi:nitrogen fixation NifU-like protein
VESPQEVVLDHYRHPRHAVLHTPHDVEVVRTNPVCGDRVTVRVSLEGARVHRVSHHALGCTVSRASASAMTELVTGADVPEVLALHAAFTALLRPGAAAPAAGPDHVDLGDAAAFAGASRHPVRARCALLGWTALLAALEPPGAPPGSAVQRPVDVPQPRPRAAVQGGDHLREHGDGRLLRRPPAEVEPDR